MFFTKLSTVSPAPTCASQWPRPYPIMPESCTRNGPMACGALVLFTLAMPSLHAILPRIWLQRRPLAWLLLPVSWLYGALWRLRGLAYRQGWLYSAHPGMPVVVVGNVVAGGAGKTPTTIALVHHLRRLGLQAGVVSRGHGRRGADTRAVLDNSAADAVGDEPLLIRRRTGAPVWVGASRLEAARALLEAHPEVQLLVCDDGLQHLALQRDLEICVMDDRGVGNGWLLPAGPLREPWPRPVDLLLHTQGHSDGSGYAARRQLASEAVNGRGETCALASLAAQPVDAVAGLARPEAFFGMLRTCGLTLADTHALPDHHDFADWTVTATRRPLLCTEKDAVKLWAHQPEAWAVPLEMVPEAAFWRALESRLRRLGLPVPPSATPAGAPVSSGHGHQTA